MAGRLFPLAVAVIRIRFDRNDLGRPDEAVTRAGTPLASLKVSLEVIHMFAISAILVGIVGIVFVRRRSSRKKQQTA